jgi:hypothetical protein
MIRSYARVSDAAAGACYTREAVFDRDQIGRIVAEKTETDKQG